MYQAPNQKLAAIQINFDEFQLKHSIIAIYTMDSNACMTIQLINMKPNYVNNELEQYELSY